MFVSKKKIKKESGFSLIELMVVVGIIGILAAVAVPQFSKFQAKARQSEAKTGLSALVTAEKGFATEYGGYTIDLVNVGFSVEGGQLRYNYGFPTLAAACATMANAPAENLGYSTLQKAVSSGGISTLNVGWAVGSAGPTWSGTAYDVCTDTSGAPPVFTGVAYGDPTNSPTLTGSVGKLDIWTVDQLSNLKNVQIGY